MGEENEMVEIEKWLEIYHQAMEREFGDRILFLGIQGSYGRGEATETSDIDVVLILDHMEFKDLERYRKRAEHLPEREFLCGFVAGKEELESWDPADRFQFFFDTVPVYGKLEDLISKPSRCHAKQAALTGACNLYHGCSHNYLHTRNPDILAAFIPSVRKGQRDHGDSSQADSERGRRIGTGFPAFAGMVSRVAPAVWRRG